MGVLPMFPLGSVLVPGQILPLHVFEPRYRQLVTDCLAGDREFGVVLIERGSEVGGGDQRSDIGTVASIVEAVPFADGRWALGTVGVRRVRVERWLDDAPYPLAQVVDWEDPPEPVADQDQVTRAVRALRRVLALAAELGDAVAPATVEIATSPSDVASHQLSALAPLGPSDRQHLLAAPDVPARLELLVQLLAEAELVCRARLALGGTPTDPG